VGSNSVLVSGRGYCTTDGDSGQWRWNPMLSRAQPVLALMGGAIFLLQSECTHCRGSVSISHSNCEELFKCLSLEDKTFD